MNREIEQWQHSVLHGDCSDSEPLSSKCEGLAARLSTTVSELFRLLLNHARLQTSNTMFRALEREYSYLQLWCDGYGVPSGDLDVILAESKRLRYSTLRLLVSICHTLADKLAAVLLPGLDDASQDRLKDNAARTRDLAETAAFAIHSTDRTESDSDDSDSESDSSSNYESHALEDIIEDLKTDIQCLVDLGPRYKEPIRDRTVKEKAAIPPQGATWDQAEYLTARIHHRYPNADGVLAQILGQANWERAQRLYAAKEKNARIVQRPTVKVESASRPSGTVMASEFHDSGLGTSIPTASSYAETVFSYHGTKGGSVKIPPVPVEGQQGKEFACMICGCICQLPKRGGWKSFWKQHVISDLQPYVCVVASCSFGRVPFSHKSAWLHHLELEHGFADASHEITCPLCQERISSGKGIHLARHLEEVSLTILPANAESDEESDGNSDEGSDDEDSRFRNTPLPKSDISNGEKPYLCIHEGCERSVAGHGFPRSWNLRDHMTRVHNDNGTTAQPASPDSGPIMSSRGRKWKSDVHHVLNNTTYPPQAAKVLWCEFSAFSESCSATFRLDDEAGWIQHHVRHLEGNLPSRLTCWFCDDVSFDAKHPAEGLATFEQRMHHIREHILSDHSLTSEDVRPDFNFVSNLHCNGLLSDAVFEHDVSAGEDNNPSRLDAEAWQLAQKRVAAERDADAKVYAFNARLSSMIRQGREALRTETVEEEPYTIKCICNFADDDGNTIFCETCETWQHIRCYYPDNVEDTLRADFAHSCAECEPRSLNRQQAVERQRARIAENLAPNKCPVVGCNKEFKRSCDLARHQRTHSRPIKCPVPTCTYGFSTHKDMNRHYKVRHSSAPPMVFECLYKPCPHKYNRHDNCNRHMKKVHGWTAPQRESGYWSMSEAKPESEQIAMEANVEGQRGESVDRLPGKDSTDEQGHDGTAENLQEPPEIKAMRGMDHNEAPPPPNPRPTLAPVMDDERAFKDLGSKPEWKQIVLEADAKWKTGESVRRDDKNPDTESFWDGGKPDTKSFWESWPEMAPDTVTDDELPFESVPLSKRETRTEGISEKSDGAPKEGDRVSHDGRELSPWKDYLEGGALYTGTAKDAWEQ